MRITEGRGILLCPSVHAICQATFHLVGDWVCATWSGYWSSVRFGNYLNAHTDVQWC